MIAIIGSEGSMGKRYQAILNFLREPVMCLDRQNLLEDEINRRAAACDRIIIASPTHTHVTYLRELLPTKKPILCEKPITKDVDELDELHAFCARAGLSYHMVYQYKELSRAVDIDGGASYYNYFRHGQDGLEWDCLQIIGIAKGLVVLENDSPVWRCTLNGVSVSISDMDMAYVRMIKKWIAGTLDQTMNEVLEAHRKVMVIKAGAVHATD